MIDSCETVHFVSHKVLIKQHCKRVVFVLFVQILAVTIYMTTRHTK